MAADKAPGLTPDGGESPLLPPGGRISPAAPTVRVSPAEPTVRVDPAAPAARVSPAQPTVRVDPAAPAAGAGRIAPRVAVPFTPVLPARLVAADRTITTRLAAAAAIARAYEPPAPLTNPLRHPLRWLAVTAASLAGAIVFAHLGALFITGLYYLLFEVNSSAAAWWHSVIPDAALRHTVKAVAEGFYGGAVAQQLVWNPFKSRRTRYLARPMNRLDRLEDLLRIPNLRSGRELSFWQIPYSLVIWAPIYGSVGFTATYLLDSVIRRDIAAVQHTVLALSSRTSMWQRTASMDTADWDMKVMGLAASFCFGRRPLRKVFDGVQLWFAERNVIRHQPVRWYYPPTFRARCGQVSAKVSAGQAISLRQHGRLQTALVVATLAGVGVLIALGYYVLTFVAG
ncbi:MAG TPA: hypothetical protein VLX31_18840 [Streptosporangiaceae bacterium]|nr:hypothetical protein [Streptosporangiaceae bacterium]